MHEKSEVRLSAKMRRLEQPSLTVEAEPENVLNTASPGRRASWILPSETMAPEKPTTGGLQTPVGMPIQLGPSPLTQQYSRRQDLSIPSAQWGASALQEQEFEEDELFGDGGQPGGEHQGNAVEQDLFAEAQDKLQIATTSRPTPVQEVPWGPSMVE